MAMIHQQIFIEACREPFSGIVKVSSLLVPVHHESMHTCTHANDDRYEDTLATL